MRYILEHAEKEKNLNMQTCTDPYRWKQVAWSNDFKMLKGIAGSMDRIVDMRTGTEMFRTAPHCL